jgi:hypothetical protein
MIEAMFCSMVRYPWSGYTCEIEILFVLTTCPPIYFPVILDPYILFDEKSNANMDSLVCYIIANRCGIGHKSVLI